MRIEQRDNTFVAINEDNGMVVAECTGDPSIARNWEPCSPATEWSKRRQVNLQNRIAASFRVFGVVPQP
jgi:hypothetical protein